MKRIDLSELALLGSLAVAGFGAAIAFIYADWRTYQPDAHAFAAGLRSLEIGLANLSLAFLAAYLWPTLRDAKRQA